MSLETKNKQIARKRRDAILNSHFHCRTKRSEPELMGGNTSRATAKVHAEPSGGHAWGLSGCPPNEYPKYRPKRNPSIMELLVNCRVVASLLLGIVFGQFVACNSTMLR